MPTDRFVLILVAVIAAAGVTVLVGVWAGGMLQAPGTAALVAIPLGLAAYLAVRVIGDRLKRGDRSGEDGRR